MIRRASAALPQPAVVILAILWLAVSGATVAAEGGAPATTAAAASMTVEARIPLGRINGRIDHLAFDPTRKRLYVAEFGNDSVGIIDLQARRMIRTIAGFDDPQGVVYEPTSDTVYVANGGDGSVRVFRAEDFKPLGKIELGDDADNVRVDPSARRVYVGYGNGAIAVIDPATRTQIATIELKGHPEGFQLNPAGTVIYVNIPDAGEIAVLATDSHRQVASWPTAELHANYPIALDAANGRVVSIFRRPSRLEAIDLHSGRRLGGSEVCADSDDVFLDPRRRRLYVTCGEGFVDTFDASGEKFTRVGRMTTSKGARTGLFIPGMDLLLVATRESGGDPAAIWLLRPSP